MKDARGVTITVGCSVCFAKDIGGSFNLGQVAAIMDTENVALTSPSHQSARGIDLIVTDSKADEP